VKRQRSFTQAQNLTPEAGGRADSGSSSLPQAGQKRSSRRVRNTGTIYRSGRKFPAMSGFDASSFVAGGSSSEPTTEMGIEEHWFIKLGGKCRWCPNFESDRISEVRTSARRKASCDLGFSTPEASGANARNCEACMPELKLGPPKWESCKSTRCACVRIVELPGRIAL